MRSVARLLLISIFLFMMPPVQAQEKLPLSELLSIIRNSEDPAVFSSEAHGGWDDMYAALWINGSTNSKFTSLKTAAAELAWTFDVSRGNEFARASGELKLVNSTLYGRISEVTVQNSADAQSFTDEYKEFIGQWYHIDLVATQEQWKKYYDDLKAD